MAQPMDVKADSQYIHSTFTLQVGWLLSAHSLAVAAHADTAQWTRARADESGSARLLCVWAGDGAIAMWQLELLGNIAIVESAGTAVAAGLPEVRR